MQLKKRKLIIYISLTVICSIMIFLLSAQNRKVSGDNSLQILTYVSQIIEKVFGVSITDSYHISRIHDFFRKTAHFTAYAVLSVCSYNAFRLLINQKKRAVTVAFSFCILTAISDEIHQLFVPGRSGEIRDVLIDTLGICLGLGLVWAFNVILKAVKNSNQIKK